MKVDRRALRRQFDAAVGREDVDRAVSVATGIVPVLIDEVRATLA